MRNNITSLLTILLCTSAAVQAVAASLTPLGHLSGDDFNSIAKAVSADGSVVVGYCTSASGTEAFRWTPGGGMVGLGYLPGGDYSKANGVSADGSVIVGASTAASSGGAFRWTSDGGMVGLGGGASVANGVSADGSVIVGSTYSASNPGDYEAFRWTSGSGTVGLGTLPSGWYHYGTANGVSADGSVIVGSSYTASGNYEAFRWTSGSGTVWLGTLPSGAFWADSYATAVSGDGSTVVGGTFFYEYYFPDYTVPYGVQFFRWTSGGGMVALGQVIESESSEVTSVTGVSGDGSVIVGYSLSSNLYGALRWTENDGIQRLWDVLLSQGVDPAADGWTNLSIANGISTDGNAIVGYGTRNGKAEAFIATLAASPVLAGDYNNDGMVSLADYTVWRDNLGAPAGTLLNDPNNDVIGPAQYATWKTNFGNSSSAAFEVAEGAAVPEPSTFVQLMLFAAATTFHSRMASR